MTPRRMAQGQGRELPRELRRQSRPRNLMIGTAIAPDLPSGFGCRRQAVEMGLAGRGSQCPRPQCLDGDLAAERRDILCPRCGGGNGMKYYWGVA